MKPKAYKQTIKRTIARLRGSTVTYNITPYNKIVGRISSLEPTLKNKSDRKLQETWSELKRRIKKSHSSQDLIIKACAIIREAAKRTIGLRPFDVQITAGLVMYEGKLAEMQTGEGKTLAAVFPAVLNTVAGKGVHILTFNDYLAQRDALWMGPVYMFLNLNTGYIRQGMTTKDRRRAYTRDITYVTAKEAGFDYLRDSLCYGDDDIVHRPFHFAIVDEADSIMIDEARIPLILAGQSQEKEESLSHICHLVDQLIAEEDFDTDEYARNINLTEKGILTVEQKLGCSNLYDNENYHLLTRINCALHARYLLRRDVDYIVRNGKIEQVDEFTGRVAQGRRWPDGLQAAVEAKENITGELKGTILNSITLQHFLRMYPKIGAMTATAVSAEDEFKFIYDLNIVVIPPHKPCKRIDHPDVLFRDKQFKWQAVIDEIAAIHQTGRPVLVGTCSVEESDRLGNLLRSKRISCHILNARNDAMEAKIISEAGRLGAVTISTNMAGRGTDIRLGGLNEVDKHKIMTLGGLYVIGTNRHESRRIDDQLRGRAGRQGDPGSSRFFISLTDDINERFRLNDLIENETYMVTDENIIDSHLIKKEVNRVQRIVEGQSWEIKKTLFKYSSLLEAQRKLFFKRRRDIYLNKETTLFKNKSPGRFYHIKKKYGLDKLESICREILLYHSDQSWSIYLAKISDIREGIHLHSITGFDPFYEFQKKAIEEFDTIWERIEKSSVETLMKIKTDSNTIDRDAIGIKAPSATWTYVINDSPAGNALGAQLMGNVAMSIGGAMLTPLLFMEYLWRKRKKKRKERQTANRN